MFELKYSTPRTIEVFDKMLDSKEVRLLVRLECDNHPTIKGNKWWKLKYNIAEALRLGKSTVLTFGGAYSNHIYAAAAACLAAGLKSVGVIRGEPVTNPVLTFATKQKMHLEFVSREQYKLKEQAEWLRQLSDRYHDPYIIPEGGTNHLALKGCDEWARVLTAEHEFDILFLPVGTAGTLSGLICGLKGEKDVVGISVLKDGVFLEKTAQQLIKEYSGQAYGNWKVLTSYDHGGYARSTGQLGNFMAKMLERHSLHLDHVYTGKMMFAVWEEIRIGNIRPGTTILALHTGGVY